MNKRDLYYVMTSKHFDLGLLKEIYANDSISICNLANSMYLAIPFEAIEKNIPVGVVVDVEGVKKIIEDNKYVYAVANSYASQNQSKYIVPIDDKLIEVFLPIKQKRELNGNVSSNIDLQFEEQLLRQNNDKGMKF